MCNNALCHSGVHFFVLVGWLDVLKMWKLEKKKWHHEYSKCQTLHDDDGTTCWSYPVCITVSGLDHISRSQHCQTVLTDGLGILWTCLGSFDLYQILLSLVSSIWQNKNTLADNSHSSANLEAHIISPHSKNLYIDFFQTLFMPPSTLCVPSSPSPSKFFVSGYRGRKIG